MTRIGCHGLSGQRFNCLRMNRTCAGILSRIISEMATSHINGKHFLFFQAWFGSLVELELANTDLKRDPYFLKHFRFGHSKKAYMRGLKLIYRPIVIKLALEVRSNPHDTRHTFQRFGGNFGSYGGTRLLFIRWTTQSGKDSCRRNGDLGFRLLSEYDLRN